MKLWLMVLLLVSCSHKQNPESSSKITKFVQEYIGQFQSSKPENKIYIEKYEDYLKSVQTILADKNFDSYLNGLRQNSHVIQEVEKRLPERYKQDGSKEDYEHYKTRVLTGLHDRLNQERAEKLEQEYGEEIYTRLLENNREFSELNKNGEMENTFPL